MGLVTEQCWDSLGKEEGGLWLLGIQSTLLAMSLY